jgi:putative endonuclease
MNTREKRKFGEERAIEHLLTNGYSIVSKNYQSRGGEIDCVAETPDAATLVFVEVKSAKDLSRGHPFTWITPRKQRRLISMARQYLADHQCAGRACRFDVIAIVGSNVEHMENAFWG